MVSSDIRFFLSPSGNSNPNLSLGGVGIGSEIGAAIHNLFDFVSPEEALAGDVEYRSLSIRNTHVSDILYNAYVWISTETSSTDTIIAIAYDSTGTQSVVNESTAPSSPALSFSTPLSKATGISLGNIGPGDTKRIWLRRTVTAGAAKVVDEGALTVEGGTV